MIAMEKSRGFGSFLLKQQEFRLSVVRWTTGGHGKSLRQASSKTP